MTGAPVTRRVVVRGRVQGVGFRWWMVEEAQALGLDGWVRNRRDGTVEAVLRGPADAVAEMLRRGETRPPAGADVVGAGRPRGGCPRTKRTSRRSGR